MPWNLLRERGCWCVGEMEGGCWSWCCRDLIRVSCKLIAWKITANSSFLLVSCSWIWRVKWMLKLRSASILDCWVLSCSWRCSNRQSCIHRVNCHASTWCASSRNIMKTKAYTKNEQYWRVVETPNEPFNYHPQSSFDRNLHWK